MRGKSKELVRIRRKYKTNTRSRKKYVNGEEDAISVNVAVLKIAGYSNIQISRVIGISRGQVAEILLKPFVQSLLVDLRLNLSDAALDLLQSYTIEAVQAIADVMRTSSDDKVVIQAAGDILDRAGLPKTSRSEKKTEHEETYNFTDDGIVEAIRQLPPEKQEEAAQMIESLEEFLSQHAGMDAAEDHSESADE